MQNSVSVGETVVDSGELFLVIDGNKTFARRGLKLLRFQILIASKIKIADVVFDLSGGEQIIMFEKYFARA